MTNKIFDIKTGTVKVKKKPTGQEAKRWRFVSGLLESGIATITIAGTVLTKKEVKAFYEYLDAQIEEKDKEVRRAKQQKRRKAKKDDV